MRKSTAMSQSLLRQGPSPERPFGRVSAAAGKSTFRFCETQVYSPGI